MLSESLISILPDLEFDEAIEITKIYSISGELDNTIGVVKNRPFRKPHYTSSTISIIGGGKNPMPGEISLAHGGVLFLDEIPEFKRQTLEALRGPLEDKKIVIRRANITAEYPANFMLIASMNPCPCGYYGIDDNKCKCSMKAISKYIGKISGPFLDRMDLHIEVKPVKFEEINSLKKTESSKDIKIRINTARNIQLERYKNYSFYTNSQLTPNLIKKYCALDNDSKSFLKIAFEKLGMSARAYYRILKVARTIADLDGKEKIEFNHLSEAVQYRNLDRKFFPR